MALSKISLSFLIIYEKCAKTVVDQMHVRLPWHRDGDMRRGLKTFSSHAGPRKFLFLKLRQSNIQIHSHIFLICYSILFTVSIYMFKVLTALH
jgi:hypothetical protein